MLGEHLRTLAQPSVIAPRSYAEVMYAVDEHDRVVELTDFPQCDVGVPDTALAARPAWAQLAYVTSAGADGPEEIAVVTFTGVREHMFGMPNDEALHGHPLYERGLEVYGAFRVENSSWIRQLERMNSVHSRHRPEWFAELTHFIFTFKESTFECVAKELSFGLRPAEESVLLMVGVGR
jgi:hypothetical protein